MPNKEEMAMISGTLSDDQKAYMLEMLKYQKPDNDAINLISGKEKTFNGNVEQTLSEKKLLYADKKLGNPQKTFEGEKEKRIKARIGFKIFEGM